MGPEDNDPSNAVYEFGYGLTYTTFEYVNAAVTLTGDTEIAVSLSIKNAGSYPGREIVQVYAAHVSSAHGDYVPVKQLIAFDKTAEIAPGDSKELTISISTDVLKKWNVVTQEYL